MTDDAATDPGTSDAPARAPHDPFGEPAGSGRLLLGWALIIFAVIMLLGGWLGVSRNPEVNRQLAYFVSGGLGGMLAGIIGVGFLISDDVRKDRARLGRLEAAILQLQQVADAQAESLRDLAHARNGSTTQAKATRKTSRS